MIPQGSAKMGLASERVVRLNGNHFEITQYKKEETNNFRTVATISPEIYENEAMKAQIQLNVRDTTCP